MKREDLIKQIHLSRKGKKLTAEQKKIAEQIKASLDTSVEAVFTPRDEDMKEEIQYMSVKRDAADLDDSDPESFGEEISPLMRSIYS